MNTILISYLLICVAVLIMWALAQPGFMWRGYPGIREFFKTTLGKALLIPAMLLFCFGALLHVHEMLKSFF